MSPLEPYPRSDLRGVRALPRASEESGEPVLPSLVWEGDPNVVRNQAVKSTRVLNANQETEVYWTIV